MKCKIPIYIFTMSKTHFPAIFPSSVFAMRVVSLDSLQTVGYIVCFAVHQILKIDITAKKSAKVIDSHGFTIVTDSICQHLESLHYIIAPTKK